MLFTLDFLAKICYALGCSGQGYSAFFTRRVRDHVASFSQSLFRTAARGHAAPAHEPDDPVLLGRDVAGAAQAARSAGVHAHGKARGRRLANDTHPSHRAPTNSKE